MGSRISEENEGIRNIFHQTSWLPLYLAFSSPPLILATNLASLHYDNGKVADNCHCKHLSGIQWPMVSEIFQWARIVFI